MYLFIFVIIIILFLTTRHLYEQLVNIPKETGPVKWARSSCNYYMNETLNKVLTDNNLQRTNNDDWQVKFPCLYDDINKEISVLKPTSENQKVFIIHGADELCAKDALWKNVVNYHGREYAKMVLPPTWVLYDPVEMKLFEKEYDPSKLYIIKKNIQRQEGLHLTNDYTLIKDAYKTNYVVVQELLQNPYIIDSRKTNMRFYVLFVCQKGDMICFVHNEGFMYYTKVPFVKGSLDYDCNVTSGFIDRSVYEKDPLTHGDLRAYLDDNNRELNRTEQYYRNKGVKLSDLVFNRIYEVLKKVMMSHVRSICQSSHLKTNITFQLFGVDVAFSDELNPVVIECNKGPSMDAKSPRDSELKQAVNNDIFTVMGILDKDKHGFLKLYETDGSKLHETVFETYGNM